MEATIGGTRRHLVDVARGQKAAGLDVHVCAASRRDPDFPADLELLEQQGIGVERLEMHREVSPLRDWSDRRALIAILKRLRPDVLHTHSSKAGVLGRMASLSTGIGHRVHTPHTFAFLFEALFSPMKRRAYRAIESWLAQRTDRLIAVSPTEGETFARCGVVPEDIVRVVPNGIDPARFEGAAPLDLSQFGLDPARPTAAVIGLVYAAKGQDLALRAACTPGLEELQLLLVGPGEVQQTRGLVHELGLADRVCLTGARRDVPALLASVDMLLLPSRWEGMPYIVLEAMAASKAVVATPVDGARDLIVPGESGLIAQAITAEAIAEALRAALSCGPEGRQRMGASGHERVHAGYTIERMVAGLSTVYREVCAASCQQPSAGDLERRPS